MPTKTGGGPIRTAIVGLGRAGWNIHVVSLKDRADYKIVACVDPDQERRQEAERVLGCRSYSAWKEFLKDPGETELAIIATANDMHTPMSIEGLKAGLHVLTEKPMATSLKEAAQMMRAAKQAKQLFSIHQNYRCQGELHQALVLMRSGMLGRYLLSK